MSQDRVAREAEELRDGEDGIDRIDSCLSEIQRNGHRLGIVKSAETERITIPPNGSVRIRGYLDKKLPYHQFLASCKPPPRQAFLQT